ncbi:ATP-grasp domain-containing protein [Radiobacillus deserti]|uniref:ATP-grasp domain-containing protein n=1 Tax=Radiobacillus deserti TaxID=2594883 RepID=A0A516KH75_9BACI|nr:hypothetical protein [Radiobacillus deserti]QDP40753.1 hypothetical protein FN924_11480 [Radiobacillus deserti]
MDFTGWIIYRKDDAKRNRSYIDWFVDECAKQSIELKLVLREEIEIGIRNQALSLQAPYQLSPDFAIVRTIEPLLSAHLESLGIQVFNSSSISTMANHKGIAHQQIAKLGIPMVDTILFRKHDQVKHPPLPFPVVVKNAEGRGGKQVYLVHNIQKWQALNTQQWDADWIVQSCDVQPGKDLRVFVVGKCIIAAVLRENKTDFRANFSLGGTAQLYELNQDELEIVQAIVRAFSFDLVGIDFLFSPEGDLLFNEIEDIVGSRTLSQLSSINLLQIYVSHIYQSLTR